MLRTSAVTTFLKLCIHLSNDIVPFPGQNALQADSFITQALHMHHSKTIDIILYSSRDTYGLPASPISFMHSREEETQ